MNDINRLLEFWVTTHWIIAFFIAFFINVLIYTLSAYAIERLIRYAVVVLKVGSYIDSRELKHGQKSREITYGIFACGIFALGGTFSRLLFDGFWASSLIELMFQISCFILYYETYSYFAHRLLHTKLLIKYHAVHHESKIVTPWSAYSVHPIEAVVIGFSAPLYMLFFSMSLGLVFVLHLFGMMFTIFLHSNYKYRSPIKRLRPVFYYSNYHSTHHSHANNNFGFVMSFWDNLFATSIDDKLTK